MADVPPLPTIDFYTRANCVICYETRLTLQQVLEDRVRRGNPVPRVRYVDIGGQADLEAKFGGIIPVLVISGQQLALTTSYGAIARFIDAALGRLA
jgi:hypothetical protein